MESPQRSDRRPLFRAFVAALWAIPVVIGIAFWPEIRGWIAPERNLLAEFERMPPEQKAEFYAFLAERSDGVFDIFGEPDMGRLLQRSRRDLTVRGAEVVSNRAGMRSRREYRPKPEGVYRIVCLGDSFAFGEAGLEEDRYADQMEEILREAGATANGMPIEVLAVGISSWNWVNEATYLTSRLSSYAPDLILPLLVANDLADTLAVTGIGVSTNAFTPDRRYGSSVFYPTYPSWGVKRTSLLHAEFGPFQQARWEHAFGLWKRLEELQLARGGRMLFAVLDPAPESRGRVDLSAFVPLVRHHMTRAGLRSPLLETSYFLSRSTRLPNDGHPNRRGHHILATHFVHTLAQRGWIEVDSARLPRLDPRLDLDPASPPAPADLAALHRRMSDALLVEAYDFDDLEPAGLDGILGGVLPDGGTARPLETEPYGTMLVVFLLRRDPSAEEVAVEIRVPPKVELYPFHLELYLDGQAAGSLDLASAAEAGLHEVSGRLDEAGSDRPAVEVKLVTSSYWATIDDHTTRSYRLRAAVQR